MFQSLDIKREEKKSLENIMGRQSAWNAIF
jgi:hypothetical protein